MFNLVLTTLIVIFVITSIITGIWHLTRYLKWIVTIFVFLVLMLIVGKALFTKSNLTALHKQVEKADIGGVAQNALKTTVGNLSDEQPATAQQNPAPAAQSAQAVPKPQPTEVSQNNENQPPRQAMPKKVKPVQENKPAVQPAATGKKKSVFDEFDNMKVDGFDD